jgi:hypothetical protein
MKNPRIRTIGLAVLLVAVVPVASDQAMDATCNATGSLAGGIADPVNGDEAFFKMVNPGANIMLLLDSSGSMANLPQCGDSDWSTGGSTSTTNACGTPRIPVPATPANTVVAAVNGTCLPATDTNSATWGCLNGSTAAACTGLTWMENVAPQTAYADPGYGGNQATDDMYDCPPWGNGGTGCTTRCSGDSCLYDPNAYYTPGHWQFDSPTRWRDGSNTLINAATGTDDGCYLRDGTGTLILDPKDSTSKIPLPGCSSCMSTHGFFFYSARYYRNYSSSSQTYSSATSIGPTALFRGTFLSANPPKVVTARQVVKKLLWMTQDTTVGRFDQVRFGLTKFNSSSTAGQLISGVVPTLSVLNAGYSKAAYRAARNPMIQYVNNGANNFATGSTPVGKALLNIGQYFSQQADTSNVSYFNYTSSASPSKTTWGSNYTNSAFVPVDADHCAVCFPACQKNTVIIVTDGSPNETEGSSNFPNNILNDSKITADYNTWCPHTCDSAGVPGTGTGHNQLCCQDVSGNDPTVPRVADWLHRYNLWPTKSASSAVTLTTYAVGFGLAPGDAVNTLKAIGKMGGGDSYNAQNASDVANALDLFVSKASTDETSFAAPAVDTLQTNQSSTSDAFLSRFKPNSTNLWEGHVFQAALFDEFANGCDPKQPPTGGPQVNCGTTANPIWVDPDLDGATTTTAGVTTAVCNKVFLVDKSCIPIGENVTLGGFFQLDTNGAISNTPANLPWDAGQVLSDCSYVSKGYRSAAESTNLAQCSGATPRNIFTYLPNTGGVLTKTPFTTANVATLQPYLSIDPTWCTGLLTSISYSPLPSTQAAQLTECARQIIYFVRGYDIFNLNGTGCRGPGHPSNLSACGTGKGGERDRPLDTRSPPLAWKLGDIFHSPPVAARIPADILTCDLGYDGQCVTTLHSPSNLPSQTPIKSDYTDANGNHITAWDRYRLDNSTRHRVAIVGANDGMLHGFDAGVVDTSVTPDALGNQPYLDGTGEELWAFIPPDLLPKLWRLVKNGNMSDHQYMVDGPTMVRDVWVDGSGAGQLLDGVKQSDEFHTIAVISERSGGTQFTALDITDPTTPTMLWTFPQPRSEEAKYMSLSWTDFSARPPPIGPVRLALSGSAATTQDPTARGWEERWIVMLNGGYDPTLVRGRAVFMVDAWTGQTIWRVTDDDMKTGGVNDLGFGSGTAMFPVPGAVALLDIGDTRRASFDADGFFDTATWGDMGGNLWTARFYNPGLVGTNGRVTNWFAARTFEQSRVTGGAQNAKTRQPFFSMTANSYESTSRTLRTFIGSGNREQLMQQGATCTQDNLLGCCQAGCTVSGTYAENFAGTCGWTSTFACDSSGNMSHAAVTASPAACGTSQTTCASSATPFQATATVSVSACPGGATARTSTGTISCNSSGTCSSDQSTPAFTNIGFGTVGVTSSTQPATRFFGIWSYGRDTAKMFSDLAGAKLFDANRFTDSPSYTASCSGPRGSTCVLVDTTAATVSYDPSVAGSFTVTGNQATVDDAGWTYSYQGGSEKTGAGATVIIGCTAWSGFIPTNASGGTNTCSGTVGNVTATSYLSDFVTGVPSPSCGYQDAVNNRYNRLTTQTTTAPPNTANMRVVINASGQVEYSALQLLPGSGPSNKALATRSQVLEPIYWLEVPRDLHNCRHDPALSASTCQ